MIFVKLAFKVTFKQKCLPSIMLLIKIGFIGFGRNLPSPLKTILLIKIKLQMNSKATGNNLGACRTLNIDFDENKHHPNIA